MLLVILAFKDPDGLVDGNPALNDGRIRRCCEDLAARNAAVDARGVVVGDDLYLALKTAHRGYVLETGRIVLEDTAERLLVDPEVRKAYLG